MDENQVEVYITLCRESASLPQYSRKGDAGMDICAAVDVLIAPGETVAVPTGIKVAIPLMYEIQVRPRSGVSLNTPLRVANSPGTIDSGYRDEVCVIVTNTSPVDNFENLLEELSIRNKGNLKGTYKISKGDRIAQFVLKKVPVIKWANVDSVDGLGYDRKGGFGSTGSN